MRALTREQLEARKEKAAQFAENVLGDPDRAAEIADESLESYAERRKIQIRENSRGGTMAPTVRASNPSRSELLEELRQAQAENRKLRTQLKGENPRPVNSVSSRSELLAQIRELREENDELQDKLDKITDLAEAPEDGEEETEDDLKDALNEILDVAAGDEEDSEAKEHVERGND